MFTYIRLILKFELFRSRTLRSLYVGKYDESVNYDRSFLARPSFIITMKINKLGPPFGNFLARSLFDRG
jgi:hypothetical protein